MPFTKEEVIASRDRLLERNRLYRLHGYDPAEAVSFVLEQMCPLKGWILEIGTGKGRFLTALLRQADRVLSLDNDASEQNHARMNVAFDGTGDHVEFLLGDAARMPFSRASFDHVVSMNALHHMTHLGLVLREVCRVVKPRGKIALADFDEEGFAIMDRIHREEGRVHERTLYRFDQLQALLSAAGRRGRRGRGAGQEILVVDSSEAADGGGETPPREGGFRGQA